MNLLIRGARVIDPASGLDALADVRVRDGRVAAIDAGASLPPEGAQILDAAGLICAPGLVDMHVHLRDPGQTHKEDIASGARAAAAGGVTSLVCMPNTLPPLDSPALVADIAARGADADARVYVAACVTAGQRGAALTDFAALKSAGAAALTDDGRPVADASLMRQALRAAKAAGLPLLSHAEELSLVRGGIMHEGAVSRALGVPGIDRAAENVATARDIALAEETGCPVHICHVSTAESAALLRAARARGVPVTGETAPHYLLLTDEALRGRDADYRMNPPLRTAADSAALIEALRDGTLTVLATDHAPHTPEEKADFLRAPNGAIGMETLLAASLTALALPGYMTLSQVLALMTVNPARLLGIADGLTVGGAADIVLFDPAERWVIDPARLHGKSRNCPFKGMTLTGRVKLTLLGGRVVYHAQREVSV